MKRALDLFSPVHGQFPPPDAEAEEKSLESKAERQITITKLTSFTLLQILPLSARFILAQARIWV
ncbi:hypothetical protein DY000_02054504 [Brassica cretica]|uniref:Uncharacterized protein n=1 Tax=Brassica cretica TaxID=69181 RepID=A0ABQ7ALB7_BRACR|nr:hypothetical protein DY000_02054503 [Brassica cretica]KAF3498187.1 hypothetical protein DY000_02054504 [Brassica cretica]